MRRVISEIHINFVISNGMTYFRFITRFKDNCNKQILGVGRTVFELQLIFNIAFKFSR